MLLYFIAPVVPVLAIGGSVRGLLYPFAYTHTPLWFSLIFFFSAFLFLPLTPRSGLIMRLSCPTPRISHFPEEPWCPLKENGIRTAGGQRCGGQGAGKGCAAPVSSGVPLSPNLRVLTNPEAL